MHLSVSCCSACLISLDGLSQTGSKWYDAHFSPSASCWSCSRACSSSLLPYDTQPGCWQYLLIALALLRLAFIPFFLLCNVQPRSDAFTVIFNNDSWPIAGVVALGLSNGFLATMAMVSAPEYVCAHNSMVLKLCMFRCSHFLLCLVSRLAVSQRSSERLHPPSWSCACLWGC